MTDKPNIAFIDDEERVLRTLQMHFKRSHNVFITTDPDELLEYVKNNHVHVVVSDQRMPKRQGVDVLKDVSKISPHSIRILLTGYADLNAIVGSINEGEIYRYITKPWKPKEFKQIIDRATQTAIQTEVALQQDTPVSQINNKRYILVLDDDEYIYREIARQFQPAYEVVWASTLEEAYEQLASGKFGVMISDVRLNGENISPIIYTLKQDEPDLMVVVVTAFKDAHLLIDLINKGQVYRCLPKPISFSLLEISVQRAYDNHLVLSQRPELTQRFEVEEVEEEEKQSFSGKIKGFISRFRSKK